MMKILNGILSRMLLFIKGYNIAERQNKKRRRYARHKSYW